MPHSTARSPLAGLRVLDLSEGIAGPFCAKLLGDLGASVVKVERPGTGDPSRWVGPFPGGVPHPEKSGTFFFLNTSKRSVVLDLDSPADRARLDGLLAQHDIVVCSASEAAARTRGLDYESLAARDPRTILTRVTGFGSGGPRSEWASSHLVACALGGWAQLCGVPEREPLQAGGAITQTLAGAFAAAATLQAVLGRTRHGHGEYVDVSEHEATLLGAQIPTLYYEYRGLLPERYSSIGAGAGAAYMLPTRNGYIGLNALTPAQWRMLCEFLGREDIASDPRYATLSWAAPDERIEEVRAAFREAIAGRSAEELFHAAARARVPFGLVPDLAGLFALPPHRERGFYVPLEHPVAGTVHVPGVAFTSTATRSTPTRPPLLGEHTDAVFAALEQTHVQAHAPTTATPHTLPARGEQPLALAGLRVLDLSMFFAGPSAAQILADAGADVIKVESIQRIDGWRGSGAGAGDAELPAWESSPYFNWINRNKRGITLDLNDERGRAIVMTLVRKADVLIENYTPRVMAKFGLDYATLRAANPALVMLSLSGFGATTSWRDYPAYGMSTEQMSGVAHLTGYEGDGPLFTGMTGGDLFSGVLGAHALLAALHHRDVTGEGQHLDFSQIEACNLYVGDEMAGYSLTGVDPQRRGNTHAAHAPQGIYRCADGWLGLTCTRDADRRALAALLGRADWLAEGGALSSAAESRAQRTELDAAIAAFAAQHGKMQLMALLQAEGIAAGAVMNGPDLIADPQLAARAMFTPQDRPGLGIKHYPRQPWRLRNTVPTPNRRAPLLGEHLEEVLREEAGLSDDEIAALIVDEVTGTVPLAAN